MAENFHSGVCGENWWTTLRNAPFAGGASPCSVAVNDAGLYGWAVDMVSNIKARSFRSGEENIDGSLSDGTMIFDNTHKALPRNATCQSRSELAADPAVDMMGFGQSSQPVPQWNQALLEKLDQSNYSSILQGEVSSTIQKEDWSSRSFSDGIVDASMINGFKQISPRQLSMDQSELTCVTTSSSVCTATTCEGFSTGFPIGTGLSGSSCGFPLMQSILDETPNFQSQHQSILNDRTTVSNLASALNSSNRSPPSFSKLSSPLKPLSVNHQPNQFQLSNIAVGSSPISSLDWTVPSPPTLFDQKPSCFTLNPKRDGKDTREMESAAKKSCAEPTFKRPRIETPSPLPTFKVRKEKLGDRITALQQLVSPFGKTDTASVLHEAIVYIKILHDQLHALSIPYLRNNNGASTQHGQGCNSMRDSEGPKQDLRSRGLCLVPISSTFPVAHEAPFEFWTPAAFGATFR